MDIIQKIMKIPIKSMPDKIDNLISHSIDIRNKILQNIPSEQKIKLLIDDIFNCNIYIICLDLILIKTTDRENIKIISNMIDQLKEYNYAFNTDIKLLKVILQLYSYTKNPDELFFLMRIIKSMEKYGTCNSNHESILKILKIIDSTENLISDILDKPLSINIDRSKIDAQSESIMSSVYPDRQNKIIIDKSKYYYLIKNISDRKIRIHLENSYMKRYIDILPAISKLIISRNAYAKLLDAESYYAFISSKSKDLTENFRMMIRDLNTKIDIPLSSTIKIIQSNIKCNSKLKITDVIYGLSKLYPSIKFKPFEIIQAIILLIKSKFKITFKTATIPSLYPGVNPLEIYDENNKLRGYLFLDLLRHTKKSKQLSLLRLTPSYGNNLCILYLIGSFTNLEDSICSFSDVVLLFREFGTILNNIFCITPTSISEDDIELINFMPDLMEFFAYDPKVLNILCKSDKKNIQEIISARYNELLFNMKLKCISVLFDNIIHDSNEFIEIARTNDQNQIYTTLFDLYKKIFIDIFEKVNIDTNITTISPHVIHNVINGQQGVIFGNVLSIILAFNVYSYINTKGELGAFYQLLENRNYSYKENLINFIKKIDGDYYDNFMTNCLKIKSSNVENCFDQTEQSEQS
jgi:hypothetical protein